MKVVFDEFLTEGEALLPINLGESEDSSSLSLDLWGFDKAAVIIDIKEADQRPVYLSHLHITTHNFNKIIFAPKKYQIKIDKLELNCAGVSFSGEGLIVTDCSVLTSHPKVTFKNFVTNNLDVKYKINEDVARVRELLKSVEMIPGCGEYVLDPDYSFQNKAFTSLNEAKSSLPNLKWIAPVVSWFATSLNLKDCQIKPGYDRNYLDPSHWQVGKYTRYGEGESSPISIIIRRRH